MNWKNLFSPGKELSAAQAREYMEARGAEAYQLLDVRPSCWPVRILPMFTI